MLGSQRGEDLGRGDSRRVEQLVGGAARPQSIERGGVKVGVLPDLQRGEVESDVWTCQARSCTSRLPRWRRRGGRRILDAPEVVEQLARGAIAPRRAPPPPTSRVRVVRAARRCSPVPAVALPPNRRWRSERMSGNARPARGHRRRSRRARPPARRRWRASLQPRDDVAVAVEDVVGLDPHRSARDIGRDAGMPVAVSADPRPPAQVGCGDGVGIGPAHRVVQGAVQAGRHREQRLVESTIAARTSSTVWSMRAHRLALLQTLILLADRRRGPGPRIGSGASSNRSRSRYSRRCATYTAGAWPRWGARSAAEGRMGRRSADLPAGHAVAARRAIDAPIPSASGAAGSTALAAEGRTRSFSSARLTRRLRGDGARDGDKLLGGRPSRGFRARSIVSSGPGIR